MKQLRNNKRLLELLKESGFCFWEDEHWNHGNNIIDWSANYEEEMETFISLLIEECASISEQNKDNIRESLFLKLCC